MHRNITQPFCLLPHQLRWGAHYHVILTLDEWAVLLMKLMQTFVCKTDRSVRGCLIILIVEVMGQWEREPWNEDRSKSGI